MAQPADAIREYARPDRAAVEACFRELQDFEREIDPERIPAETIVEAYIDAEAGGKVVGFLCVWLEPTLAGMLTRVRQVAYISDVVVSAPYRRRGIGTALLARAEAYALSVGASGVLVGVLAGNRRAWDVDRRAGFVEYDLRLLKPLT
jgi:GNAT superfamily N-acetyltransferase